MSDETYATPWAALAAKLESCRTTYETLGAECWEQFDVTSAIRFRGRAEGLKYAQGMMREEVDKRPEDGGWTAVLVDRHGQPVDPVDTGCRWRRPWPPASTSRR
jgi:hypothetical protein